MRIKLFTVLAATATLTAWADYPIDYSGEAIVSASSGDLAPYFIASNNHGILTQKSDALLRAKALRPMTTDTRFSYGFGVDLIGGYTSSADYKKFNATTDSWYTHSMRPSVAWIQQLYGEVKWRGVFLTVGLKEYDSNFVNPQLSSGDLTFSGNTRPIPGMRTGFIDFQDIPFTNGWLQIVGSVGFNKSTDNNWTKKHFNYYQGQVNQGWWYNYKSFYLRTKPSERFCFTLGAQAAGQFGGEIYYYAGGKMTRALKRKVSLSSFFDMIVPKTGEEYVKGNHVGSLDFKARYRLRNESELTAYAQFPWEDGSGLGKKNGFDGLYGIEYKSSKPGIVNGAVVEYLDFRNQSGPIHWDPVDFPGTTVTGQATGRDNYYNNNCFNGYSIYGMSIGTPFLPSPIYNYWGQNYFTCTRIRGFHAGVMGELNKQLNYRLLFSYRKGWGNTDQPFVRTKDDTSMMLEGNYRFKTIDGLAVKAQLAYDAGRLYGNNFGALLSVIYSGNLNLSHK